MVFLFLKTLGRQVRRPTNRLGVSLGAFIKVTDIKFAEDMIKTKTNEN